MGLESILLNIILIISGALCIVKGVLGLRLNNRDNKTAKGDENRYNTNNDC